MNHIKNIYFKKIFTRLWSMNRYGIDWFSQINFFSNLYYHNINFITGATGVGKSTQVLNYMRMVLNLYFLNLIKIIMFQELIQQYQMLNGFSRNGSNSRD